MSISKTAGEITFTYTYTDLFDVVSVVTNEVAVTILNEQGDPLIDEYGVSEDEVYSVTQKMYDAANEVFNKLMKITNGIADSVTLESTGVSCAIKDKAAYNENVLIAIDRLIKSALFNYIIYDWFQDKQLKDHAGIYFQKYRLNVRDIAKKSVQLRKSAIS